MIQGQRNVDISRNHTAIYRSLDRGDVLVVPLFQNNQLTVRFVQPIPAVRHLVAPLLHGYELAIVASELSLLVAASQFQF